MGNDQKTLSGYREATILSRLTSARAIPFGGGWVTEQSLTLHRRHTRDWRAELSTIAELMSEGIIESREVMGKQHYRLKVW